MKKPSEKAIEKEIATLRGYIPRVRPTTAFGDSNTDAIGAQVKVLADLMDNDEIYDTWGDDERVCGVAIEALEWLKGNSEEPPSKEWKPLLKS